MYRYQIFYIPLVSLFLLSNVHANDCPLKGKWKSNAELTLEGVRPNETLTKKRIEYLSKEFFGKLIVEFTCDNIISHLEGETSKTKYKIVKKKGNYITIEFFDEALGESVQDTLELIGDCYYSPPQTFGIKEAMCKINE